MVVLLPFYKVSWFLKMTVRLEILGGYFLHDFNGTVSIVFPSHGKGCMGWKSVGDRKYRYRQQLQQRVYNNRIWQN